MSRGKIEPRIAFRFPAVQQLASELWICVCRADEVWLVIQFRNLKLFFTYPGTWGIFEQCRELSWRISLKMLCVFGLARIAQHLGVSCRKRTIAQNVKKT